jgi:hypothetical protein
VILYLHGFRSSPRSIKARQLATRLDGRGLGGGFRCPQLPASPRAAAALIDTIVRERDARPLAIVGSSLGGYYATWAADRVDCRLVLLNPATRPDRDLERHLGRQTVYHSDETVDIEPSFLDELKALRVGPVAHPGRCLLVAATGDTLLDWREMVARYPDVHQRIIEGSDHGLADFGDYIDDVIDFAIGAA